MFETVIMPTHAWSDRARCKGLSNEDADKLFFLNQGGSPVKGREFCQKCPVLQECFNEAILYGEQGIWGGSTKEERDYVAPLLKPVLLEQALADHTLKEFDQPIVPLVSYQESSQCQCCEDTLCDNDRCTSQLIGNLSQRVGDIAYIEPLEIYLERLNTELNYRLPA